MNLMRHELYSARVYICNICEEEFDGDRTTCRECFEEIAALVKERFSIFDNPKFSFTPTQRKVKLRTSVQSCSSKSAYKTPEDAVRARKRLGKTMATVKSQRIYKCNSCEFWHLTSVASKNP